MAVPTTKLLPLPASRVASVVRNWPDPRDLVARFPLPAVIIRPDATLEFANPAARRDVAAAWLARACPQLLSLAGQGHPGAMVLQTQAGGARRAMVYAAGLGDRVVAVLDPERTGAGSSQVLALHRRILELERTALTDRLTGLWNRRHFDDVVGREIGFSESQLSPLSLVLFDIDHFKRVNDAHGHAIGDDVLRNVAVRLRAASRPTDLLFRWGGEEFALLMPATSGGAAVVVAERLRAHVAGREVPVAGPITISAGVAEHEAGESAEHWFERVDGALYEAKHGGRNRSVMAPGGASSLWHARQADSVLRLVWSDALVSGNDLIDDQHRALFHAANGLMATLADERVPHAQVLEEVDCLLSAVARHFTDEEAVLAATGYPDLPAHRELHRKLLDSARRLRGNVQAGTSSAGEVVEFLAYEIVHRHILRADKLFFPYVARA